MTRVCCPSCRLRFTRAAAANLVACPQCGEPPQQVLRAQDTMAFRLVSVDELPDALLPAAVAVAVAVPVRGETPS